MSFRSFVRNPGVLFLVISAIQPVLVAQGIRLPRVTFNEPPVKIFNINEPLRLDLSSSVDPKQLRARIFWGSKQELIEKAKNSHAGVCVYYPSFTVGYSSRNGEVTFGWVFQPYSLRQTADDGFDNQSYTVVLELANSAASVDDFRLSPKDVDSYFSSGQDIVLVAPPSLHSGAASLVGKVQMIRASEIQLRSGNSGATVSFGDRTRSCIILTLLHASTDPVAKSFERVACGESESVPRGY
jgi:hypothetical protein